MDLRLPFLRGRLASLIASDVLLPGQDYGSGLTIRGGVQDTHPPGWGRTAPPVEGTQAA